MRLAGRDDSTVGWSGLFSASLRLPDALGDAPDERDLGPLLVLAQLVSLFGGREAALRRETQALQGYVAFSLADARDDAVLVLELGEL